jgi:sec-independent protein translocase protein TatA
MEGLFQPIHLVFIFIIVLIIFGPGKLPELGKGLGKGIREFKESLRGGMEKPPDASSTKEDQKKA